MSADRLHSRADGAAKPARRLAFSTPMGASSVAVGPTGGAGLVRDRRGESYGAR